MNKFDLQKLVRQHLGQLKPYSSARDEFDGQASIYLDANENSYGSPVAKLNRYPDPLASEIRKRLADIKEIKADQLLLVNGSDEGIDLLIRVFCEPGQDSILITPPTYGMYEVSAAVNNIKIKKVALSADYQLNLSQLLLDLRQVKLLFLCSPNNPTGNILKREALINILESFDGIVVLDEAYIDFCPEHTFLKELDKYPNLVILQTLSKAWGLAGARLGLVCASSEIIALLRRIKPPYNINSLTQQTVAQALLNQDFVRQCVRNILREREWLTSELKQLPTVKRVFESHANFLLVQIDNARDTYQNLLKSGIVVRDRSQVELCEQCLRVTVGTTEENQALIAALKQNDNCSQPTTQRFEAVVDNTTLAPRSAQVKRSTSETEVLIKLNLDGTGHSRLKSGLGFLDHMLDLLARHALLDLEIGVKGDLHVDEHHTLEDVAITLGEALRSALGDKRGIERYGFVLPMDEARAEVLLDLGGRAHFVWNVRFMRERVGDVPTELWSHFFKSISDALACNLHISASGENDHHIIEGVFKAFARSLRAAKSRQGNLMLLPSTKGKL